MNKFIIIPDLSCDLSEEIRTTFNVEDYVVGHTNINGLEIETRLDWSLISRSEFYKTLANKKNKVSSSAPNVEEFYLKFKKYIEQGYDILSMSISSTISATYSNSVIAKGRIMEEYPSANIYCLDTKRMSGSFGLLVIYALELQKEGKTFEEIIEWLEINKHRVHQMGPIDDLTFIARRGQISKGKAIMGNLVGIKPMGDCNSEGYVTILTKVKGIKKAIFLTAKYIKETAVDIENQYIIIAHSDSEKIALLLKEEIEKNVKCKAIFISDVFTGSGTNIGPDMIGAFFLGNPVSSENKVEKEIMAKIIAENE